MGLETYGTNRKRFSNHKSYESNISEDIGKWKTRIRHIMFLFVREFERVHTKWGPGVERVVRRHAGVPTSTRTDSQGEGGSCTFRPRAMKRVNWGPGDKGSDLGRKASGAQMKQALKVLARRVLRVRRMIQVAYACRLGCAQRLESAKR